MINLIEVQKRFLKDGKLKSKLLPPWFEPLKNVNSNNFKIRAKMDPARVLKQPDLKKKDIEPGFLVIIIIVLIGFNVCV